MRLKPHEIRLARWGDADVRLECRRLAAVWDLSIADGACGGATG